MLKHNITDPQELERFESAMRKYFGYADFTKDEEGQYKILALTTMAMLWQIAKDEHEESIFVVGDTVYHPTLGRCSVARTQGDEVFVSIFQGDEVFVSIFQGDEYRVEQELLSFETWPLPVHVRPVAAPVDETAPRPKDGWWNVRLAMHEGKGDPMRRYVTNLCVYRDANLNSFAGNIEDYDFIEYIGD